MNIREGSSCHQFSVNTIIDPKYFYTEERWKGLLEATKEDSLKVNLTTVLMFRNWERVITTISLEQLFQHVDWRG